MRRRREEAEGAAQRHMPLFTLSLTVCVFLTSCPSTGTTVVLTRNITVHNSCYCAEIMFVYLFNLVVVCLEWWQLFIRIPIAFFRSLCREIWPRAKKSVHGQIVLITGAGHGLGREMAFHFSRLGAILVLWDIDKESAEKTGREIRSLGGRAHAYHVDVSEYTRVLTATEKVREEVGDVDILINNAGTCKVQPFTEISAGEIRKTIAVNLTSHFWTIKAFLPQMLHQGKGHIVAISSNLAIMGKSHFIDYSAAKFGVNGLMQALEAELYEMKKRGIKMTTICPAAIDTGLVKSIETRFPRFFPLLDTQTAARLIVDSILRNDHLLIIPPGYRYLYGFLANCPRKVSLMFADFLGNTTEID